MDGHLGYDRYERSDEPNYRNGTKPKRVRSKYGEFEVDMPQDRQSSFEPQVAFILPDHYGEDFFFPVFINPQNHISRQLPDDSVVSDGEMHGVYEYDRINR